MIRVLVVDASPVMRASIARALTPSRDIVVVGEAGDPHAARHALWTLRPDVMTLDVEMPGSSGLDFVREVMAAAPMPIVMVSGATRAGAEATLTALELGAVECVAKPRRQDRSTFDELPDIVRAAQYARLRPSRTPAAIGRERSVGGYGRTLLAIGASTGGVEALLAILPSFPADCPPTVVAQHMPGAFTRHLAARLNGSCAATVAEATDGALLLPGHVYLAPGGDAHLEVAGLQERLRRCRLVASGPVCGHRPSVDVLFRSVAAGGASTVGVILTGMGRDGAAGLLAMRQAGCRTLGQDEASSVVYGMPRAAMECGAVERQVALADVPTAMLMACAT